MGRTARSSTANAVSWPQPLRGAAWVAAILLLAGAIPAVRWAWADLEASDAWRIQRTWQPRFNQTGRLPDVAEWTDMQARIKAIRRIDPVNPAWIERNGNLLAWRVRDGETIRTQYAETRDRFAEAVVAMPSSGYAWANLAWVKYQLGEIDARFFGALEQAARLGPWEPEVQVAVVDLGFAAWDEMPASLRATVRQMAENGSRRNAQGILTISAGRGRLTEVCGFEKLSSMAECRQRPQS